MRSIARTLGVLIFAAALQAQPQGGQPAGVQTQWDIGVALTEIGLHAGRLIPALDAVKAKEWVRKGAPDAYVAQLESSREQARAIETTSKALARNPEKLADSLELLLRLVGLDDMLASLEDGMRRYQGEADAQTLRSVAAENGVNRDRFTQYLVTLASDRERQLEVMDQEAQRCRSMLLSQPSGGPGRKK
jgi:hypothetical protein